MIDNFTLGFYCPNPNTQPNVYQVHHFNKAAREEEYNVLGVTHEDFKLVTGASNLQLRDLHGQQVTFRDQNGVLRPTDAVIRWHYMQCVLRNLSTNEFRMLPVW
jgi:UDP-2,3-diacylglucosamine pyrophosphatase LpxH